MSTTRPVLTVPPETHRIPTPLDALVFSGKASLLRLRRLLTDGATGLRRHPQRPVDAERFPCLLAESRTPLWREASATERRLQLGKVQNLRCAVRQLNGTVVPAGEIISFWKQIGQATVHRGYAAGREIREGCLIPTVGGGLCQLSNALCDAAHNAGLEIVERHPHTRQLPGATVPPGRDATVFWNYLDLRLQSDIPFQIEAFLTRDTLVVRLYGARPAGEDTPRPVARPRRVALPLLDADDHSCVSCGQSDCFRHDAAQTVACRLEGERTAFLLDERWPEFATWIAENHAPDDLLAIPLDGARWHLPRYAHGTAGFARVETATLETLRRALTARQEARLSPARARAAQLAGAERLARSLARTLTVDTTNLVVALPLLPTLWRDGHLGGRRYSVLMTRYPLAALHARLDAALARYPERRLLGDFRAPAEWVDAETAALADAERIITPHADIAALFPGRAILLPWQAPMTKPGAFLPGNALLFPGPTAARKGAYEVREAARRLNREIVLAGRELEGNGFWDGIRTRRTVIGSPGWLDGVAAIVQPSLAETEPRVLLRALAAGIPVVATSDCGLGERAGVYTVPALDPDALTDTVARILVESRPR